MMTRASSNRVSRAAVLALPLAFAACATTGTAVGELRQSAGKETPVAFVWKSDAIAPERGKISGTLPDGSHYSGRYFEVVKTAKADLYLPAWAGWRPYWAGWRTPWFEPVGELDWNGFVEIYTGRVIANMTSDSGQHLRCRFKIAKPVAGLKGGGSGDCQLESGETIDHVVLASS